MNQRTQTNVNMNNGWGCTGLHSLFTPVVVLMAVAYGIGYIVCVPLAALFGKKKEEHDPRATVCYAHRITCGCLYFYDYDPDSSFSIISVNPCDQDNTTIAVGSESVMTEQEFSKHADLLGHFSEEW